MVAHLTIQSRGDVRFDLVAQLFFKNFSFFSCINEKIFSYLYYQNETIMKTMENITMVNLENPAYLEAKGLAKCWEAYSENASGEDIMEIGFNPNSGYVYIALEYGIQIASSFGQEVDFIVTDYETGEEHFLDSYEDAEDKMQSL